MKDYFGQELNVGDRVAFVARNYRMLITGTVRALTAKRVRIDYINTWNFGPEGRPDETIIEPLNCIKRIDNL